MLDWATARQLRQGENPARWRGHLDKLLPAKTKVRKVKHLDALPYGDVPEFMAKLRAMDSVSARALEFTILTAARTGETIGAQWPEIDFATKVWTVPGTRTKSGREHRVPLSDRALEILAALPREDGNEHVFLGSRAGKGLSHTAMLKLVARHRRRGLPFTASVHPSATGPATRRTIRARSPRRRWHTASATRPRPPTGVPTRSRSAASSCRHGRVIASAQRLRDKSPRCVGRRSEAPRARRAGAAEGRRAATVGGRSSAHHQHAAPGRVVSDEQDRQREREEQEWQRKRDAILDRAKRGEITGEEADAEAEKLGPAPLSKRPGRFSTRPDPREVPAGVMAHWTLTMALVWILYRDLNKVREWDAEYCAECWRWEP